MLGNIAITELCVCVRVCVRLQHLNKIDFDFDGTAEMAVVERTDAHIYAKSIANSSNETLSG